MRAHEFAGITMRRHLSARLAVSHMQMLQRNMGVKRAPERWQDNRDVFDVVVTFEERIMEQLLDGVVSI